MDMPQITQIMYQLMKNFQRPGAARPGLTIFHFSMLADLLFDTLISPYHMEVKYGGVHIAISVILTLSNIYI
jgi:hypothetical protein